MGAFADTLFSVLLSWVKSAVGSLVTLFESGGDRGLLAWLGNNWLFVVLVLVAGGLVADWLVWLVRWQPYHIWATRARHVKRRICRLLGFGRRQSEEDEEEGAQTGAYQMIRDEKPTRIVPILRREPIELPIEEQQAAFEQAQAVPEEALGAYPGQRYDAAPMTHAAQAQDSYGYAEQPIYAEQLNYVEQPVYAEQPAYAEPSVYDEQPVYAEQPVYVEQPDYAEPSAYDEQPVYAEQPVYVEQPDYAEQPAYDEQPVYAEQPVYDEEPAPAERPCSVYERPIEPRERPQPSSVDAELSQEIVPGIDPFAPYDAPEVLKALENAENVKPEAQAPAGRRRRRRRAADPEQAVLQRETPPPGDAITVQGAPKRTPEPPDAPAKESDAAAPVPPDDDLPEPPQWPDWENTAVTPVVRMEDLRIPGSRVKPSLFDRLRERVEQRQAPGGEKKRSRIANFFDPREEPIKGLAPRVKKEDAFAKPVQPEDEASRQA